MLSSISLRGYTMILVSAVLFGTYGVWSRLMGDDFGVFYQAWVRSLLVMGIMAPIMLVRHSFRPIHRQDWPALGIFIAFCVLTQAPVYYAFNHAPIGTVLFIFYASFVIMAYLVGRFYLGESITKIKWLSVGLALGGLVLVFGASVLAFAPLGLVLAGLNGAASGGEVSSSKKLSDKYPSSLLVFWGWVFTLLTHLPVSLLVGETQVPIQLNSAWLWLLVYALANAGAFWLVVAGFRHVDASIGGLLSLSEVVFGALFGALVFGEMLSPSVYIGGLLIVFAAMLPDFLNIIHHRRTKAAVEPVREL